MCQHEPLRQPPGCLVGRLAVERHHRRWHAREPLQLCPPAVAYGGHLDLVRATADGFFEAMNDHRVLSGMEVFDNVVNAVDFTRT